MTRQIPQSKVYQIDDGHLPSTLLSANTLYNSLPSSDKQKPIPHVDQHENNVKAISVLLSYPAVLKLYMSKYPLLILHIGCTMVGAHHTGFCQP